MGLQSLVFGGPVSDPERLNLDKEMRVRGGTDFRRRVEPAMTRVLIIDDDPSVGAAIQMMLARQGCDTVHTPDAPAGIQAFESSKFDVVMVDIFMPGMNGLDTITGLRQRAPTVPILAMSGFRFRDSMAPGLDFLGIAVKLGATSCLRKPFAPQQLMAAINSGLDPVLSSDRSVGTENQDKDQFDDAKRFPP